MHFLIRNKAQLLNALKQLIDNNIHKAIVLISDRIKDNFIDDYLELINDNKVEVYGGVFPSLIYGSQLYNDGFIIIAMPDILNASLLPLDLNPKDLNKRINELKASSQNNKVQSIFTLISAFGTDKTIFLKSLYNAFGNTVNYFGAGCGSITEKRGLEILSNQGYASNSGLILELKSKLEINYAHGWKSSDNIYKVTECVGNEIISINWEPAFKVYQQIIASEYNLNINKTNFFEVAKQFPLGMLRLDSELIIRDPYGITKREGILVVDKIEEGEFIKIMFGTSEGLLNSTKAIRINKNQNAICFNCISRKLFHQENISSELNKIAPNNLIGAFSIGEIVNHGDSYLEMFNKIVTTAKC